MDVIITVFDLTTLGDVVDATLSSSCIVGTRNTKSKHQLRDRIQNRHVPIKILISTGM